MPPAVALALPLAALLLAPSPDLADVKARGVLRVIISTEEAAETFAPGPDGNTGFEGELLEGFARLQGLRIEVVRVKIADRVQALLRGDGDVVAAIFDTPQRREVVEFTAEVMPTHNLAVTLAPRKPVATIEELRALKVAVVKGTQPATAAAEAGIPPGGIVSLEAQGAVLAALQKGDADAAILPVSEFVLRQQKLPALQPGVIVGPTGRVAWAVRKKDTELRASLDAYIANVRRASTWSRLIVKYFGDRALAVLGRQR